MSDEASKQVQQSYGDARVVRRRPRPRALIRCDDDQLANKLERLFPTTHRYESLSEAEQLEWDVLVAVGEYAGPRDWRGASYPAAHLYIIALGATELADVRTFSGGEVVWTLAMSDDVVATEFTVPATLPARVDRLVREDLIPAAEARAESRQKALEFKGDEDPRWQLQPFALTAAGGVLAGRMEWREWNLSRAETDQRGGELWFLPEGLRQPVQWVEAALEHWRSREPDRFLHRTGWQGDPRWAAPEEVTLVNELTELSDRVEAFNAQAAERRKSLEASLAQARVRADKGHRRLLTARGDDLADAVAEALRLLGFDVRDMDDVYVNAQKLEDLRLRDPDDDRWEALVEVRGHKRGATPHDLLKIDRFLRRYRDDEGRWPSALWYIVNQFVGSDPATRPPVLATDQPDVDEFAQQSGLVIDTADLFDLIVGVTVGELDPADVRAHLRMSTGRFEPPGRPGHDDDPA